MKSTKPLISLFLLIAFAGCSPREEKIDGSIFIVTKGAENVKLGLVTVSVFDEQQVGPYLTKTTTDLEKTLGVLKDERKQLREARDKASMQRDLAKQRYEQATQKHGQARDIAEQTAQKIGSDTRPEFTKSDEEELASWQKTLAKHEAEAERLRDKIHNMEITQNETMEKQAELDRRINPQWGDNSNDDAAAVKTWVDTFVKLPIKEQNRLREEDIKLGEQFMQEVTELETTNQELTESLSGISNDENRVRELESQKANTQRGQELWDELRPVYLKQSDEEKRLDTEEKRLHGEWDKAVVAVDDYASSISALTNRLENWFGEAQPFYFVNLPTPLATTKSDADGKFSLLLPRKGKFILSAQAQRQILDKTEKYYWLVRIHPDGTSEMQIMLSNDNLITANSGDSAIQFPTP